MQRAAESQASAAAPLANFAGSSTGVATVPSITVL